MLDLDALQDPAALLKPNFSIALPSSSSIGTFWQESHQVVALPHDLQALITSKLTAIYIGFRLLLTLVRAVRPADQRRTSPPAFEHQQPWILDSTIMLWRHFKRWSTSSEKQSFRDETVTLYLHLIEALALPTASRRDYFVNFPKAAQALTSSLSSFAENDSISVLSESNQIRLALLFTRLRSRLTSGPFEDQLHHGRQALGLAIMLNSLESIVAQLCQSTKRFSAIGKDMKVSTKLTRG